MWSVYIVKCKDGKLYTGITTDVGRRLKAHNTGRGAKFTKGRRPVRLVYSETARDRSGALRREAAIRKLRHDRKLELL